MDGKHIILKRPVNSGSYYFNYKGSFSIVLLAIVDADYKFIYVDVGCNGRISDGGVFRNASISEALEKNMLNIPPDREVAPGFTLPYVIVADDAFPLKTYIMKPFAMRGLDYEKRIFNYRLSRARRIVENAFGILASRFRVFLAPSQLSEKNTEKIVLASCVLHNFLREKSPNRYTPGGSLDMERVDNGSLSQGGWRSVGNAGLLPIIQKFGSNYGNSAKNVRDTFCQYFNTVGQVAWQDKFATF